MAKQRFFNLLLDISTTVEALEECEVILNGDVCSSLFFVNAHCFNIAQKDQQYTDILNSADLVYNDGSGIKIGSWFAGVKMLDNLNGTDLIPKLISLCKRTDKKVFLLGTLDERLEKAKENIKANNPGVKIVGTNNGFFTSDEEDDIIQKINNSNADMLIVGMGVPYQEKWVDSVKSKFDSVKLVVAGGAVIDFMSGSFKRAPKWMQKLGIEWIYRLLQEPGRLMKRYMLGNFTYLWHVLRLSFNRK
jgi:N-acetylglucosaminyldiphosphoundecaprenol N-acetyl-beta-D-mannosaminyltransferase